MSIFEIISAIVLILACVFIVVVVLMKDTKTQMSQQISGTSSDSFYQRNVGRTKDAILNKATIVAAVIFFVLAVAVNLINVYGKDLGKSKNESTTSNNAAAVTSTVESTVTSNSVTSEEASAAESTSEETSAESEPPLVDER
ncbi:MAG: preprotein translocase subunit SecG [Oscillospiraceae bacterium]|nr:preprotein translocase subunit SecG [Oscillospiraceae bacterium]